MLRPGPAHTLADSICVGHPRNWRKALSAVRASDGAFVAVPDEAILDAQRETGRRAGLFGEPAAVAAVAAPARPWRADRGRATTRAVTGSG
jgi:threonine synthase